MLYRTMLDNEEMDMQDPQYMSNVNDFDSMQDFQTEPQRMPYMGYPMMDEMYDPSTYGYQMPQQQYQLPAEDNEDMDRSKHHDSYHDGYKQGYNHGYGHGYHHGHNGYNNYNYNQNFPLFPLLPLLFFRN